MTPAHVLAAALVAALAALARAVRRNRRQAADLSAAKLEADWLRRLLGRKGWRQDPAHPPAGPRLAGRKEPPRPRG